MNVDVMDRKKLLCIVLGLSLAAFGCAGDARANAAELRQHDCLSDLTSTLVFNDDVEIKVSPKWRSNSGISLRGVSPRPATTA